MTPKSLYEILEAAGMLDGTPPDIERLTPMTYTTIEAATLLGIDPRSVRAFINRGLIAATKHGRDWLITQDEIDRYNRERRHVGRPSNVTPQSQ